jgi:hypothetical protein
VLDWLEKLTLTLSLHLEQKCSNHSKNKQKPRHCFKKKYGKEIYN